MHAIDQQCGESSLCLFNRLASMLGLQRYAVVVTLAIAAGDYHWKVQKP